MRRKIWILFVVLTAGLAVFLPGAPAVAGTTWDYPEFPYQPTAYDEPLRGQFHFSSQQGWMNDPNGLVYANGLYHFFYQHNPHGLAWDTMHWGHATSPDLVHWTQKPIALEPGVHPGDLWSGGGVVDKANTSGLKTGSLDPIVVFSNTDGVSVFYSNDNGRTFQAYDKGRKVVTVPAGVTSRDPKVFWDAARNRWAMVVWSDQGGNGVSIYTSPNLLNWTFASRFQASWLFECPDLYVLPLDGRADQQQWVLTSASGQYEVGTFDGTTFRTTWTQPQQMNLGTTYAGGSFYAAETFTNTPDGRTVQMAWQGGNQGSTWTGDATFPVTLGLVSTPDGPRITRTPVAELSSLASDTRTWQNQTIDASTGGNLLSDVKADTYEITAQFDVTGATATQFGFDLHARADGTEDRRVAYDTAAQTLYGKPLPPRSGKVSIQLLVDRGQLEIFADSYRYSLSDNVAFDSSAASQGIRLFATGGRVKLDSLTFARLGSSWGTGQPTQSTLDSNLGGPWHAPAGTWTDVAGGKQGSAGGDGFYLSASSAGDAVYQGDLTLGTAQAAGLTFHADASGAGYTANIDDTGVVKLWRPGRDIAVYHTPITQGRTYHLKVQTDGARIRVWLDNGASPVIDATDTTYASGLFGANVFSGAASVQNLNTGAAGLTAFDAGRWTPAAGTWTVTPAGLHGSSAQDGFYLSDRTGTDFTYQGDLSVTNGVATGLTFRANASGAGYTANVDTSGLVKLWRPGQDIAVYHTPITEGLTYHLRVQTTGARIRVWLNNGPDPVIDATDTTYASGLFGVNAFSGDTVAQNLSVS
ncbi:glycoside hydrolase family 32 protein [Actinacidiphila acididurans]|uniref:Glycoside hydrolase family 32 protein n=1 Tax=Actinacidiphila acididurans TaxID=2784346 RepID=A0ABS2TLE7_9ACTN|nr:glycoside hydrolase family 32 protein [Actinacidiphila acididurans]MBM9504160.1 glycoside hydrolase family 32 protein [Actinacidiphila acididurans]